MLSPERKAQMDAVLRTSQQTNTLSPERKAQMDAVLGRTTKPKPSLTFGGVVKSVTQPLVDAGRFGVGSLQILPAAVGALGMATIGKKDEGLKRFNEVYQNSAFTPEQKNVVQSKGVAEPIKYGARTGANIASYLVAPTSGVTRNLASRAVSHGLSNATASVLATAGQGSTNPIDYIDNAFFGTALGVGTPVFGSALGKIFKLGTKPIAEFGENYAVKSTRIPSKAQAVFERKLTGLDTRFGKTTSEFIQNTGLYGQDIEKVKNYIRPLQDQFESLQSGKVVNPQDLVSKFDQKIAELSTEEASRNPALRQLKAFLQEERDMLKSGFGEALPVGIGSADKYAGTDMIYQNMKTEEARVIPQKFKAQAAYMDSIGKNGDWHITSMPEGTAQSKISKAGLKYMGEADKNFLSSLPIDETGKSLSIESLVETRKGIDRNTPRGAFKEANLAEYNKMKNLGNIYREVINDTASTSKLGKELSALYSFQDLLEKAPTGKNTLPVGITQATLAGSGLLLGNGILGKIANAVGINALVSVLNNPRVIGAFSRLAGGISRSGNAMETFFNVLNNASGNAKYNIPTQIFVRSQNAQR